MKTQVKFSNYLHKIPRYNSAYIYIYPTLTPHILDRKHVIAEAQLLLYYSGCRLELVALLYSLREGLGIRLDILCSRSQSLIYLRAKIIIIMLRGKYFVIYLQRIN